MLKPGCASFSRPTALIRRGLENGLTVPELEAAWQDGLNRFMEVRREFLLYPEL